MYDTKSRELRWNATYSDYASTLPDDDTKYSKTLRYTPLFCYSQQVPMFPALRTFPNRNGSFCLQRRRPSSDGGQRLRRRSVGAELQLPRSGHLYLAARGPPQSSPHQRGRGNPAVPHLYVWRGWPHHTVEIPVSQREET